jgi:type II secretion system protein H
MDGIDGMDGMMRTRKDGFTLIELLVVIVIIGVLFAVALPVFENAGKKDTDRAAQQLVNVLRLARQHAIAKRQWTLVVFPNADATYSANVKDANNLDKCLRSYAVLAVTNNMDGQYKFDSKLRDPGADDMEFEFVSEWKKLPDGIYFDDDSDLKGNFLFGKGNYYQGKFKFPWNPEKPKDRAAAMSAMLFKPNGRAYVMNDGNGNGKYWQDTDGMRVYVTSAKIYQPDGTSLDEGHALPGGTNTIIQIQNKTGQMKLLDEGQLYDD